MNAKTAKAPLHYLKPLGGLGALCVNRLGLFLRAPLRALRQKIFGCSFVQFVSFVVNRLGCFSVRHCGPLWFIPALDPGGPLFRGFRVFRRDLSRLYDRYRLSRNRIGVFKKDSAFVHLRIDTYRWFHVSSFPVEEGSTAGNRII
jgi:hypothetical protein